MLGLCKRAIHTRIYIVKNERYISIEKKIKKLKFNDTPVSENPDPQGNLVDPPENFGDFSEETQEKFLASLGPELQDLFHKGATGQIDEAEISKYMRNMSPEEIQRITDSPIFAQFLGSDSRFNIPSKLDPDVPLSRADQEKLSSNEINWDDLNIDQQEEDAGGEGEEGLSQVDQERVAQLFAQFQQQLKKDRLRYGKE